MIKKSVILVLMAILLIPYSYAEEEVVKRVDRMSRPKLIKKQAPTYPKEALKKRISGNVILKATIDKKGRVESAEVVSSPDDLLSESAIKAIRCWQYEPYKENGKSLKVQFTVNVTFALDGKKENRCSNSAPAKYDKKPVLIRRVAPKYPAEAREKQISGQVLLEATADVSGNVKSLKVVKTPDSLLSVAAMEAVKQWKYKPYIVNGTAKELRFTVCVNFSLDKKKGKCSK